jgi:hypothetical protein
MFATRARQRLQFGVRRERRAVGFGLFGLGLWLSALQTPQTDYDGMFWPQVIRGLAIMFCLLPPTRLQPVHDRHTEYW